MPTYPTQLVFEAPAVQTGQASNVECWIYDHARTALVTASNSPGGTPFAESPNVPGCFYAPYTVDVTKLPITVDYAITGQSAAGTDVIGQDFAAMQAQGYSAAMATVLAQVTVDGSGYLKSRPQTLTDVVGTGAGQINLSSGLVPITSNVKKDQALSFPFRLVSATDGVTPVTGLGLSSIICLRSLDGGAFVATVGNVSAELGHGVYVLPLAAADINANVVVLVITATGAQDVVCTLYTQP